jgi:hypothetical protein
MQWQWTRRHSDRFFSSNAPFALGLALAFVVGAAAELSSNHIPDAVACVIMAALCFASID